MANQYATIADFTTRYDSRIVGDLVSDSNSRVTNVTNNATLNAMLQSASGEINSACLVSNRYSVTDLLALTDVDQQYLIELCCNLAFKKLRLRRGMPLEGFPQIEEANKILDMLRSGERVFNFAADKDAGLPEDTFPSMQFYSSLNLLRDRATIGFFSPRRQQSNS